jgi:hypothetical protein
MHSMSHMFNFIMSRWLSPGYQSCGVTAPLGVSLIYPFFIPLSCFFIAPDTSKFWPNIPIKVEIAVNVPFILSAR